MEENMIRGGILSMQIDNETKTKLFKWLDNRTIKIEELIEKFEEEIEKDGTLTKLNSYDLLRAVINDLEELLED